MENAPHGMAKQCFEMIELLARGTGLKLDLVSWEVEYGQPPESANLETIRLAQLLARRVYAAQKRYKLPLHKQIDYVAFCAGDKVEEHLAYMMAVHLTRYYNKRIPVLRMRRWNSGDPNEHRDPFSPEGDWSVYGARLDSLEKARVVFCGSVLRQDSTVIEAMQSLLAIQPKVDIAGLAVYVKRDFGIRTKVTQTVGRRVRLFYFFECDLAPKVATPAPPLGEPPDDSAFRRPHVSRESTKDR